MLFEEVLQTVREGESSEMDYEEGVAIMIG
jgi:hypothetical protein